MHSCCSRPPTFCIINPTSYVHDILIQSPGAVGQDIEPRPGMAPRSVSSSTSTSTHAPNSWTNPRKRPHSYDPTAQLDTAIEESVRQQADSTSGLQSSKRIRTEEWPLKNSDDAPDSRTVSRLAKRKSPSSCQKRASNSSTRPSRFVEGSMNDRVSQRPPSLYIREEQAMEEYTSANMEDVDMIYDAGIESNRSSGVFRFGKAIANAFNSVNVWQGLNGIWKEREKENQAGSERDVLKARAELKYAELKKSGYQGTQNAPARPESQEIPKIKCEDTHDSRRSSFRDSGVDVDEDRSSSDRRDSDQFITSTESLMPPPPRTTGRRSASPFSDASSGRRSSIRFHKPSLEGLKKVKSQIHLPPIKRTPEEAPSLPSEETSDAVVPGLRRQASKKDVAKQYKLSKKVSDLENKLEAARRELELSLQEAPPVPDLPAHMGRRRFVPGTLASLPSERLLTPQSRKTDGTMKGVDVRGTTVVDAHGAIISSDNKGHEVAEHVSKAQDESVEAADQALWNRRASDIAARNVAARQFRASKANDETDDVLKIEVAKGSVSKRQGGRPRKLQEKKVSGSHGAPKVHLRPPKIYAQTPRNSPVTKKDEVPPVPVKCTVFDPTKVDQTRVMAMRAIPNNRLPFGKAWDDLKNLRKEYPEATDGELEAYISSLAAPKKFTDHTSVSHGDRPSSPLLARPSSTSPMKTRARASRRGISPPPPSLSSAKKFHRNLNPETSSTPASQTSPVANEEAHHPETATPMNTFEKGPKAARASLDKPLPDIKPDDDFEWDDDVF